MVEEKENLTDIEKIEVDILIKEWENCKREISNSTNRIHSFIEKIAFPFLVTSIILIGYLFSKSSSDMNVNSTIITVFSLIINLFFLTVALIFLWSIGLYYHILANTTYVLKKIKPKIEKIIHTKVLEWDKHLYSSQEGGKWFSIGTINVMILLFTFFILFFSYLYLHYKYLDKYVFPEFNLSIKLLQVYTCIPLIIIGYFIFTLTKLRKEIKELI